MAIEDNILDGLDLSVLDNLTTSPEKKEDQLKTDGADLEVAEEPSIFNPELKIQEVDVIPESKAGEELEDKDEIQTENT